MASAAVPSMTETKVTSFYESIDGVNYHITSGKPFDLQGYEDIKVPIMRNGREENFTVNMFLSRRQLSTNDGTDTKISSFLRLSLSSNYLPKNFPVECQTGGCICEAWIVGKTGQCNVSVLKGGLKRSNSFFMSEARFVRVSDLLDEDSGLLIDGKLNIAGKFHTISDETKLINNPLFFPERPVEHNWKNTLVKDLSQLLTQGSAQVQNTTEVLEGIGSDVTLVSTENDEFPAHALLLSCRSSVFRAMFNANMKEKKTRRVEIPDASSNVLSDLLQFIYTDKAPNIDALAPELLVTANKYDIPRLKMLCEQSMVSSLSLDNAVSNFITANLHGATELQRASRQFIARHICDIKKTEEWKQMMKDHQEYVDIILDELAKFVGSHFPPYGHFKEQEGEDENDDKTV